MMALLCLMQTHTNTVTLDYVSATRSSVVRDAFAFGARLISFLPLNNILSLLRLMQMYKCRHPKLMTDKTHTTVERERGVQRFFSGTLLTCEELCTPNPKTYVVRKMNRCTNHPVGQTVGIHSVPVAKYTNDIPTS